MKSFLAKVVQWFLAQAGDPSRQYTFGTAFFTTQVTNMKASPPVRIRVRELHGRVRYAIGLWAANATAPQVADTLYFVRLPKGVMMVGFLSLLSVNAGTAGSTITVGDTVSTSRHLAASAINAAAEYVPSAVSKNLGVAGYVTTDESRDGTGLPSSTNDTDLLGVVGTAVVAVTQNIALHVAYVQD